MSPQLYRHLLRASWLLLVMWQPVWHGWLVPQRWLLGVILGVLLLLPLAGIWLLRAQAIIIGSLLAIAMLIIALMEIVAVGLQSAGPIVQGIISSTYLLAVMWRGRQLKQQQAGASSHE
ncbi:MAG: hypothetical protein Tsb0027_05410 [Wenzhouxiangellaceae bacterium]